MSVLNIYWKKLTSRIVGQSLFSLTTQVFSQIITLIVGVFLARILGVKGYGVYSYTIALTTIVAILSQLGTPTIIIREISKLDPQKHWIRIKEILTILSRPVLITIFIVILVLSIWLCLKRNSIDPILFRALAIGLCLLPSVIFLKIGVSIMVALKSGAIGEFIEKVVRPLIFVTCVGISFWSLGLRTPQSILILNFLSNLATISFLVYFLTAKTQRNTTEHSPFSNKSMVLDGMIPLTLLSASSLIANQVDILMLGIYGTIDAVGIYRIAVQGSLLMLIGLQIANTVFSPYIVESFSVKDNKSLLKYAKRSSILSVGIAFFCLCVFFIFGKQLIYIAFGQEYLLAFEPLCILCCGLFVNLMFGPVGMLLRLTGHEKYSYKIILCGAMLNVLLNYLLIPKFGVIGASISTASCYIVSHMALFIIVNHKMGINPSFFGPRID